MIEGTWGKDDIRRAFVEGAKWWSIIMQVQMLQIDQRFIEKEAEKRYGPQDKSEEEGG